MKRGNPVKKIPGYVSWIAMNKRCRHYEGYIAKGIEVCKRWKESRVFLDDMGDRPEGMTLGRIDNSLGYSPDNCRWETPQLQARNRDNNVLIEFNGKKITLSEVVEITGIARETLQYRVDIGRSDLFEIGIRATKKQMEERAGRSTA
jgi:hypothetical protein